MGGFGSSRIPEQRPLPVRPTPVDPAVQRAGQDERRRLLARRGTASTFITSPLGLTTRQPFRGPRLEGS